MVVKVVVLFSLLVEDVTIARRLPVGDMDVNLYRDGISDGNVSG